MGTGPALAESERRQLTVVFCDVVNSTALSESMDTEDFRDILLTYRDTCAEIIHRHGGQIAKFIGDGIMAHYGFPTAHEDDARLAVQSALEICNRMPDFSRGVEGKHAVPFAVRTAVHTGLVVVDKGGPGAIGEERGLIGSSLNIGARLQELAPPNGVVISQDTFQLVQGHFILESLGPKSLKGASRKIEIYRVVESSSVRSIFEARVATGLSPLVGRTEELALLQRSWTSAKQGMPVSILVSGDPGIGKSRLLHEFQRMLEKDRVVQITCNCLAQYRNTAFYPIATEMMRVFTIEPGDNKDRRLAKVRAGLDRLEIENPELSRYIELIFADAGERQAKVNSVASVPSKETRQEIIRALTQYVTAASKRVRLLLIFEDLQWADPSTLELLGHLCKSLRSGSILMLASARSDAPLELPVQTRIKLGRIMPNDCMALVTAVAQGSDLPAAVAEELVERSDGVPLFVEELTKAVRETIDTRGSARSSAIDTQSPIVPSSLHDSLMGRLDRLGSAKEVAQVAATIGRSFHFDMLSSLWPDGRPTLRADIDRLAAAELIFRKSGATSDRSDDVFEFKHELVRSVAYESLLRVARRDIHRRIATSLESRFATESARIPELVAHHYTESGMVERALPLWQLAGKRAVESSASLEAIAHFSRALTSLESLPESSDRKAKELELQLSLAVPLMVARGYGSPELDRTVSRAMMLSREIGDPQKVFPLMYGRWSYQQVTGHVTQSLQLAREIVTLAKQYERGELLVIAYRLLGTSLQVTGDPVAGVRELEQAVTLFDPEVHTPLAHVYGSDVNVTALCSLALAQWTLGLHGSANRNIESAWKRSVALGHDNTLAYCGGYRLAIRAIGERVVGFREILDDFSRLMTERRLPVWLSVCKGYLGWLQLRSGEVDAAVRSLRECIAAMTAINLVYWQATIWMWLGDALGLLGDLEGAEEAFSRSLEIMTRSGERWAEPELYRLWACGRRRAGTPGVEELFQRSLNVAREQRASAWSVRTYLDLTHHPNTAEAEKARNDLQDILLQIPESERGGDFAAA